MVPEFPSSSESGSPKTVLPKEVLSTSFLEEREGEGEAEWPGSAARRRYSTPSASVHYQGTKSRISTPLECGEVWQPEDRCCRPSAESPLQVKRIEPLGKWEKL